MRVVFSPLARRDLKAAGEWIERGNARAAVRLVALVRERALSLSDFPERYPRLPDRPSYRRMPCEPFVVIYRVGAERVEIVRVVHEARDIEALLTFD